MRNPITIGPVSNYYILISFFVRNIDFWNDRLDNFDKLSNLSGCPRVYHGGYRVQIPIKKRKQRLLIKFDRQNLSKCLSGSRCGKIPLFARNPNCNPITSFRRYRAVFFPPLDICIATRYLWSIYNILCISNVIMFYILCNMYLQSTWGYWGNFPVPGSVSCNSLGTAINLSFPAVGRPVFIGPVAKGSILVYLCRRVNHVPNSEVSTEWLSLRMAVLGYTSCDVMNV